MQENIAPNKIKAYQSLHLSVSYITKKRLSSIGYEAA